MANEEKSRQLGMPFGTASARLRKIVLFDLLCRLNEDHCYRCQGQIESVDDLSIEHKEPWLRKDNKLFWDLDNIAFSHLSCNVSFPQKSKTSCPNGHPYSGIDNRGRRICHICHSVANQDYRKRAAEERFSGSLQTT